MAQVVDPYSCSAARTDFSDVMKVASGQSRARQAAAAAAAAAAVTVAGIGSYWPAMPYLPSMLDPVGAVGRHN